MSNHQDIDIYETILKEERQDRLYFWSIGTTLLFCGLMIIATSI